MLLWEAERAGWALCASVSYKSIRSFFRQWSPSFPSRIFLSLAKFVDTWIPTCLGAMTHSQKVWLLWGLPLLMYAISHDAVSFFSFCIPCLLSYSSVGRRKKNCSLLFNISHFNGSFVPLGTQMIFSKQIKSSCLFFLDHKTDNGSLKIQPALSHNS